MGNTSTRQKPENGLVVALSGIPRKFRTRICHSYSELKRRYSKAQYDLAWDSSGLTVGKFCEAVLRFLEHELTGNNTPFGKHIPNFPGECHKLVRLPKSAGLESLRVIIPRALVFLYTVRGKRGIGHVGGDVEANAIDAAVIVRVCDWVLCEMIRVFHRLSLEEAQALVDAVSERNLPEVWEVRGKKRVLRTAMSYQEKALLLLYSEADVGVLTEDLFDWVEHPNLQDFRRRVLDALHKAKMIEWDRDSEIAYLSPLGVKHVEVDLLAVNPT